MKPFVVGVDLSLTSTGVASRLGVERIRSSGHTTDSLDQRWERLTAVSTQVATAVFRHGKVDLVVIEGPSMHSVGGHAHDRSGLWWLVVNLFKTPARWASPPLAIMAPTARSKYGTGKGNAGKDAVLAAVIRRYPQFDVDGNDVADALLLCAAGMDFLGHPLVEVPAINRQALIKVAWPSNLEVPA